jgi:hypothetical protein
MCAPSECSHCSCPKAILVLRSLMAVLWVVRCLHSRGTTEAGLAALRSFTLLLKEPENCKIVRTSVCRCLCVCALTEVVMI